MTEPTAARLPRPRARGPMRRRDLFLLIGLAIAVVTFSAISISVNALRPDVPTTSNSTTVDPRSQESDYILHIAAALPGHTQAEAIAVGRSVCTVLSAGLSRDEAAQRLQARGYSAGQADLIISAATDALCPANR